jgi:hypothetical protein
MSVIKLLRIDPMPWRNILYWARASSLLILPDHSQDTPHSVGLLWTSDRPDAETSTWRHTTVITACPWDSKPQSQQTCGRRPTFQTMLPPRSARNGCNTCKYTRGWCFQVKDVNCGRSVPVHIGAECPLVLESPSLLSPEADTAQVVLQWIAAVDSVGRLSGTAKSSLLSKK